MLPGPTNVPNRVMRAMLAPIINHRSDDFVELYTDVVDKTQQVFQTQNDIVALSASGTGAVEAGVINVVKKGDKVIIPVNGEFSTRLSQLIEKIQLLIKLKKHLIIIKMSKRSMLFITKLLLEQW